MPLGNHGNILTLLFGLALLGAGQAGCAAEPRSDAATLMVGNKGEDSVSFIDLASGREVARTDFGPAPHEIALSPDGRRIAVVAYGGQAIAVIDVASRAVIRTIELPQGARPHGIVWHASGRIYATAEGIDSIAVIDRLDPGETPRVATISTRPPGAAVGAGSHMLVVNAPETRAWTANLRSGSVTLIDLAKQVPLREAATGEGTEGIALSPDGRSVWVTARGTGQLLRLSAESLEVRSRVRVGRVPLRAILSPDGLYAVTANFGDGTISVVRASDAQLVDTIQVPGGGEAHLVTLLFSPDGKRLYAALTRINRIAEYSFPDGRFLGLLAGGAQGDGLAIAPVRTAPIPARTPALTAAVR